MKWTDGFIEAFVADKAKAQAVLRNVRQANGETSSTQFNLHDLISKREEGCGQNMIQDRGLSVAWNDCTDGTGVRFFKVALEVWGFYIHISH